jgi:hypothetical protein
MRFDQAGQPERAACAIPGGFFALLVLDDEILNHNI